MSSKVIVTIFGASGDLAYDYEYQPLSPMLDKNRVSIGLMYRIKAF